MPVEYIVTTGFAGVSFMVRRSLPRCARVQACTSTRASSGLHHRQPCFLPRTDAACELVDFLESQSGEYRHRAAAALATIAVGDERTAGEAAELACAALQFRQRNVQRVRQTAAREFLRFAQIEQYRIAAVDEARDTECADRLHRRQRSANERPREHRARRDEYDDQQPIVLYEAHRSVCSWSTKYNSNAAPAPAACRFPDDR